ncbi:LysR substrate-binding domain-containing protein [Nostoc sp. NIES-2111]
MALVQRDLGLASLALHRGRGFSVRGRRLRQSSWRFDGPGGTEVVRSRSALRLNNVLMMRGAVLAGVGLAFLPRCLVHDDVCQGALRIVELDRTPESAGLFVAHAPDGDSTGKIRRLIAHL